jgi:hypothetical protein
MADTAVIVSAGLWCAMRYARVDPSGSDYEDVALQVVWNSDLRQFDKLIGELAPTDP